MKLLRRRRRKSLTPVLLFSALMPDFALRSAMALDWGLRFLAGSERRRLERQFEYAGSNIPLGADPLSFWKDRNEGTRVRKQELVRRENTQQNCF